MMEEYFVTRESLKATVLLIDSRHEPTKDDQVMYDFLKHYEIPVIVVATKIDKLSKSKKAKHLKAVKDVLMKWNRKIIWSDSPLKLLKAKKKPGDM